MFRFGLLFYVLLAFCFFARAQQSEQRPAAPAKDTAAYTRDTAIPPFTVLLTDSTTVFSSADIKPGNPVALFYFSPGCGHCRRAVEELRKEMRSIRDVHFYFLTNTRNTTDIRAFCKEHHLERYKNIKAVGTDLNYVFLSHFSPRWSPELALFDSNLKFVALLKPDGITISAENIYNCLHNSDEKQ
ncbi:MAG: hypothetical protein KF744_17035 [Taibaiella sp.]|nr:hypothetical protein [Taibaiella sp.]